MPHFEFYELPQEVKDEVSHLRWQMAGNRMLLAYYRLEELLRKANFNPDQPRAPAGSGSESGRWTSAAGGASPISRRIDAGRVGPTRIAVSGDPLKSRPGNNPAAQVSNAVNAIATGRQTSIATVVDTMSAAGNATLTITREQTDRVVVTVSTSVASLRGTGTLSSLAGQVTVSNFTLAAPGLLNPLSIVSAPRQIAILDAPDGTLRIQIDRPLIVRAPILGRNLVDYPAGSYVMQGG